MCRERLVEPPRIFEAHLIASAHGFQTAIQFAAMLGVGLAREVFEVGAEEKPILGRCPINEFDEFRVAHGGQASGLAKIRKPSARFGCFAFHASQARQNSATGRAPWAPSPG